MGMTLTEAAACATPAVATAIPGHVDAVVDGVGGLLAKDRAALVTALDTVLSNRVLRQRLGSGAEANAAALRWEVTAGAAMAALAAEAGTQRSE
jgi:glycosyltransferase involved in cell wall biosynthesis